MPKKNPYFEINNIKIGKDHPPYLIAEMSANHNGSIEEAFKIISAAKANGADAIKLQTYKPDTITLDVRNDEFILEEGLWEGRSLFDLYEEAHTPWEWHEDLFNYAKDIDLTIFSSPFDHTAVDLLEDLNAPAYKIASFEVTDLRLIEYVASTLKPLIISTGMANKDEIGEAVEAVKRTGNNKFSILHCVSGYPAPQSDYNLATLEDLEKTFNCVVGLSDHTLDNITAITSIPFGASIVEKHFILDRSLGGPDSSFSLEPGELNLLKTSLLTSWDSIGRVDYDLKESERPNIKFRRSLYFIKDMKVGDIITEECIKSIRPGYGLPTKLYDSLLGKKVSKDVTFGTPTSFKYIDNI